MSKITTHSTDFERPDLLQAALDALNAAYRQNAPIPGASSGVRVDFVVGGENYGDSYSGIGFAFDQKAGRFELKIDDMDLVRKRGEHGQWRDVPRPEIAAFVTRLHNQYNLALVMEKLAQGQADAQATVLDDGTIVVDVTDFAEGWGG